MQCNLLNVTNYQLITTFVSVTSERCLGFLQCLDIQWTKFQYSRLLCSGSLGACAERGRAILDRTGLAFELVTPALLPSLGQVYNCTTRYLKRTISALSKTIFARRRLFFHARKTKYFSIIFQKSQIVYYGNLVKFQPGFLIIEIIYFLWHNPNCLRKIQILCDQLIEPLFSVQLITSLFVAMKAKFLGCFTYIRHFRECVDCFHSQMCNNEN